MNNLHSPADAMPQLLKTRYGVMNAVPVRCAPSRSLAQYGEWIDQELDLLSEIVMDDGCVFEFGSEFGAHTLWFSRAVGDRGQVHVAEPDRMLMQQLCANLALNGLANVHTHRLWLGRAAAQTQLGELLSNTDAALRKERVPVRALDDIELDALHLIKINYPGELCSVLDGAAATIRRHRPHLYFRMGEQDSAEEEVRRVKELGYRCWSHLPYLYSRGNHAGNPINLFPGRVHQNVIAAPQGSGVAFDRLDEL
ncbi:FkbM family methyltransferase [Lysobacter sp. LF1]|uniref:FkbM family methyltransferase n=1 Tax=Lysobacter stagni TaxID=3045172 RepID=A0ABT6XHM0_9GAMM|nr:FkbM family methyltransferase [Lysobacter sp. LF1]MDI9239270.1 FkbM family methyltransferase [Lysobacter sp. LF1]